MAKKKFFQRPLAALDLAPAEDGVASLAPDRPAAVAPKPVAAAPIGCFIRREYDADGTLKA